MVSFANPGLLNGCELVPGMVYTFLPLEMNFGMAKAVDMWHYVLLRFPRSCLDIRPPEAAKSASSVGLNQAPQGQDPTASLNGSLSERLAMSPVTPNMICVPFA
jgi:hypothetical protein